jgi:hypothetical protein
MPSINYTADWLLNNILKSQAAEARIIVGTAAQRPVEFSLGFLDRQIIDTCVPALHQAVFIELPVLITIRTEPLVSVIVPLVGKPDCDPLIFIGPKLFYQSVVVLFCPFPVKEFYNLLPAYEDSARFRH